MNENEEFEFALAQEKEQALAQSTQERGFFEKYAPLTTKIVKNPGAFGKGLLSGASFGSLGKQEANPLAGSVMNPNKDSESARTAGQVAGALVPISAATKAAGLAMPLIESGMAMGPVASAFTEASVAGGLHEGMRGGMQGKRPTETISDMGKGAAGWGALGVGGYGLGKGAGWLTKRVPEELANQYVDAPKAMAESLREKEKPGLGRQFLDKTQFGVGQDKNQVYDTIKGELENNEWAIQEKLKNRVEEASTPNIPTTAKEYVPLDIRDPSKIPGPGSQVVNPDLSVQTPKKITREFRESRPTSFGEDTYPYGVDLPTSKTYEVYKTVPREKTVSGGEFVEKQTGFGGTFESGTLGEPVRVSNLQGPVINLDKIRARLNAVAEEQRVIGKPETAQAIHDLQLEIAPGENVVHLMRGNDIRKMLDAEVGNAYLKTPNALPPGTEARQHFANALRQEISELAPEVADLNSRSHSLMNFKTALLPQVAERAPVGRDMSFVNRITRAALGNRGALGVARFLENPTVSSSVKAIPSAAETGGKFELSRSLDKKNRLSGQLKK